MRLSKGAHWAPPRGVAILRATGTKDHFTMNNYNDSYNNNHDDDS